MPNTAVEIAAKRLSTWLAEKNITYAALAEETGLSVSTLHTYMHKPPLASKSDALDRILAALGHTREELFAGIPQATLNAQQRIDALAEDLDQSRKEADFERGLQKQLADELEKTRKQFAVESAKNDKLLKTKDEQLEVVQGQLKKVTDLFDECRSTLYKERRGRVAMVIALCVLLVAVTVFGMYSFYSFIAFDLPTPDKGAWPPFWMN